MPEQVEGAEDSQESSLPSAEEARQLNLKGKRLDRIKMKAERHHGLRGSQVRVHRNKVNVTVLDYDEEAMAGVLSVAGMSEVRTVSHHRNEEGAIVAQFYVREVENR